MATKTIGSCASCGYPLTASHEGQRVSCPMCSTINQAINQGVTIPSWLLALGIGLGVGILAGPAIMATTETGSQWLEKQVRERVR
ncbi:MAG: hypothetical protein Q8R28_12565 [Dehalococcoidia bacterium]|nr:hypothetical protein [Dehalococcoidia bacterium]